MKFLSRRGGGKIDASEIYYFGNTRRKFGCIKKELMADRQYDKRNIVFVRLYEDECIQINLMKT